MIKILPVFLIFSSLLPVWGQEAAVNPGLPKARHSKSADKVLKKIKKTGKVRPQKHGPTALPAYKPPVQEAQQPASPVISEARKALAAGSYVKVHTLLTPLAEQGDNDAQNILGECCMLEKNYEEAETWLALAAGNDRKESQYWLALMYHDGLGVEVDYSTAFDWYYKAGLLGHTTAQYNLAMMYRAGESCEKDPGAAYEWFLKAARAKFIPAQGQVGSMLLKGEGVAKDPVIAMRWLKLALVNGDALSAATLGESYLNGEDDLSQHYALAIRLLTRGASKGKAHAQAVLGYAYLTGTGVTQDFKMSSRWLGAGAAGGDREAQFNYSILWLKGLGVKTDLVQAMRWSLLAAKQEQRYAAAMVKQLSLYMSPMQIKKAMVLAGLDTATEDDGSASGDEVSPTAEPGQDAQPGTGTTDVDIPEYAKNAVSASAKTEDEEDTPSADEGAEDNSGQPDNEYDNDQDAKDILDILDGKKVPVSMPSEDQ